MKGVPRFLRLNDFMSKIVQVSTGTFVAASLNFLSIPILSRLYLPEDFGVLASVTAIAAIVGAVGTLKLESAIPLAENSIEIHSLINLAHIGLIIFTVLISILNLIDINLFFWLDESQKNSELAIIPLCILNGSYMVSYFVNLSLDNYKKIQSLQIIKRLGTVLIQIICGLIGLHSMGLVGGMALGIVIAIYFAGEDMWKSMNLRKYLNKSSLNILKKYYKFPVYQAPQAILNSIQDLLPIAFFSSLYGSSFVGAFYLSLKVVAVPSTLLAQSIRSVFYREVIRLQSDSKKVFSLWIKTTIIMLSLSVIFVLFITYFGESIFSVIFGEKWQIAGKMAEMLVLWQAANFLVAPSNSLFQVYNCQQYQLLFFVVLGILRLAVLAFAPNTFESLQVLFLYSSVSAVLFIIVIVFWFFRLRIKSISL